MNNTSSNKTSSIIGVFDSGLGGLTILNQLKSDYPNNQFIYFGDTAHLPYGTKSKESIIQFCDDIVQFLISKGATIIVVACHTASAVALNYLKKTYDIPIIGVLESSINTAINQTTSNHIAVLGTHTTIASHSYKNKIIKINENIIVNEIECPLFVPIVEEGLENTKISLLAARLYLDNINNGNVDTVILGCTHYPILINTINKIINSNIHIIDTGLSVSADINNLVCSLATCDNDRYYVTDVPYRFNTLASKFLKYKINKIEHVRL